MKLNELWIPKKTNINNVFVLKINDSVSLLATIYKTFIIFELVIWDVGETKIEIDQVKNCEDWRIKYTKKILKKSIEKLVSIYNDISKIINELDNE